MTKTIEELQDLARMARADLLKTIYVAKTGHPGGCLSAVDLLIALYFTKFNIDPQDPKNPDRDRFLLGKGHASPAVAVVLAYLDLYDVKEMLNFRTANCKIASIELPGWEMTSGSLGQNLSVSCGMALAAKKDRKTYKVYELMGDGEMQEGQVWEAAMFAAHYNLGNLFLILDNNCVQMCGRTNDVMSIGDPGAKFSSFGWNVLRVDGHDMGALINTFASLPDAMDGKPTIIIAETIKGKGVSFMEDTAKWHGGSITDAQFEQITQELGGGWL